VVILGALLLLVVACSDSTEEEQTTASSIGPTVTATTPTSSKTFVATPISTQINPARTPGPGETLWRWANVTVIIPDDSGIVASPGTEALAGLKAPFILSKLNADDSLSSSFVSIDADNGAVIERKVLDSDRAAIEDVLATLTVEQFDAKQAGWPYLEQPTTDLGRRTEADVSYVPPSPDSGLYVGLGMGDPGGPFIDIRNGRSVAFVLIGDASLEFDTSLVLKDDLAAFQRWLGEVKRCGVEAEC
jgi:hypothetical protein